MTTKAKLVVLELVAGIFGWGWLVASGFAVYYLVMAVGFGAGWTPFFIALGAGAVSKWLARGFEDNKQRVAFEANAIAKGASHEGAGRAWVEAYTGQGKTPAPVEEHLTSGRIGENRAKAEERAQIIGDYGAFIARNPMAGEIRDVESLPYDKKAILDAICLEIVRAEDERRLEALKVGALCLADYQEGVGDQPLSRLGIDPSSVDATSMSVEELRALADKIAGNPDSERFGAFKSLVEMDLTISKPGCWRQNSCGATCWKGRREKYRADLNSFASVSRVGGTKALRQNGRITNDAVLQSLSCEREQDLGDGG